MAVKEVQLPVRLAAYVAAQRVQHRARLALDNHRIIPYFCGGSEGQKGVSG